MGKNRILSGIQVALDQIDTFQLERFYPLTSAKNFNAIERPANLTFRGTVKVALRYSKKQKQLDCVALQVKFTKKTKHYLFCLGRESGTLLEMAIYQSLYIPR